MSILSRALNDTPIAVVDIETTGLSPKHDRIVEIAVVRIDPGEEPQLVLDTLVNPQRRVSGSEIHGIYDEDVIDAPLFSELSLPIAEALEGAAVASFNVYFDIGFLDSELPAAKIPVPLPHLCLMWLRSGLGLGARATLGQTCSAFGITFKSDHCARQDAMAAAQLWSHYAKAANKLDITTFEGLAALRDYKFTKSWLHPMLSYDAVAGQKMRTALKPRTLRSASEQEAVRRAEWRSTNPRREYFEALTSALVDREVSEAEYTMLYELQRADGMTDDSIRYVHARIFAGLLEEVTRDLRVDAAETEWLAHVSIVLRRLGWVPGEIAREIIGPDTEVGRAPRDWWDSMFGSGNSAR